MAGAAFCVARILSEPSIACTSRETGRSLLAKPRCEAGQNTKERNFVWCMHIQLRIVGLTEVHGSDVGAISTQSHDCDNLQLRRGVVGWCGVVEAPSAPIDWDMDRVCFGS
jgi:hypothetical protein